MKWFLVLVCVCVVIQCENIMDLLSSDPKLSEFAKLVEMDSSSRLYIKYNKVCTVFAPTNEAIEKGNRWLEKHEANIPSYHRLNSLIHRSSFPDFFMAPTTPGAPPLYFSGRKLDNDSKIEYFVNNAKVIETSMINDTARTKQILYVIDGMLEPYADRDKGPPPNAMKFMEQPSVYDIEESFSMFVSRIRSEGLKGRFEAADNHSTYFIPVNSNYGNVDRYKEVDRMVIQGHIIRGKVLFTRTIGTEAYDSEANNQILKVELSIVNQTTPDGDDFELYAQSNILYNYQTHRKGLVLSKILRSNIPVANGVLHLIETPLMIIDITIWGYIQKERYGRLREFYKLVESSHDFKKLLENSQEKTLFAPSNDALKQISPEKLERIRANHTVLTSLLKLHLAMKSISSEDVLSGRAPREFLSADNHRNLYFRVVGEHKNRILTVEGGGVNATAELANIGATDGLIHIVDRILGMPYQTMYEKLKNDPSLRTTYEFSKQNFWNRQLSDINTQFTFFAPSEAAWDDLKTKMPSAIKQLAMGLFPVSMNKILNRHLIVGKEYTIQDLEKLEEIHMQEGKFKVSTGYGYGEVIVKWEGEKAIIVRPGVQATNGVIHVIDRVMMKQRDLSNTSTASQLYSVFSMMLITICFLMTF